MTRKRTDMKKQRIGNCLCLQYGDWFCYIGDLSRHLIEQHNQAFRVEVKTFEKKMVRKLILVFDFINIAKSH